MKPRQHVLWVQPTVQSQREHQETAAVEGKPGTKPKTQRLQMRLHKLNVVGGRSSLDPRACFPNLLNSVYCMLQDWHPFCTFGTPIMHKSRSYVLVQWDIIMKAFFKLKTIIVSCQTNLINVQTTGDRHNGPSLGPGPCLG